MNGVRVLVLGTIYDPPRNGRLVHIAQPYVVHMRGESPTAGYAAWLDAETVGIRVLDALSENESGLTNEEKVRFEKFWAAAKGMTKVEHIVNYASDAEQVVPA